MRRSRGLGEAIVSVVFGGAGLLSVMAAAALLSSLVMPSSVYAAKDKVPVPPSTVTVGARAGDDTSDGFLDILAPVAAYKKGLVFFNPRFGLGEEGANEVNVGLGIRQLLGKSDQYMLGGNVYYDYRKTQYDNTFNQFGAGLEFFSKWVDARANYYHPEDTIEKIASQETENVDVSVSRKTSSSTRWNTPFATGHEIRQTGTTAVTTTTTTTTTTIRELFEMFESGKKGFDAEVGLLLPLHSLGKKKVKLPETRVFGGYYDFEDEFGNEAKGAKGRLEIRATHWLKLDGEIFEDDKLNGTDYFVGARVETPLDWGGLFGGQGKKAFPSGKRELYTSSMVPRLNEMVIRDVRVQTDESDWIQDESATTKTVDVDVDKKVKKYGVKDVLVDKVNFVKEAGGNSDGTAEDPFDEIQEAVDDAVKNDREVVYVHEGTYEENVVVAEGLTLWGEGEPVRGHGGRNFGGGKYPVIEGQTMVQGGSSKEVTTFNDGPSAGVVSMMPNTTVQGFEIIGDGFHGGGAGQEVSESMPEAGICAGYPGCDSTMGAGDSVEAAAFDPGAFDLGDAGAQLGSGFDHLGWFDEPDTYVVKNNIIHGMPYGVRVWTESGENAAVQVKKNEIYDTYSAVSLGPADPGEALFASSMDAEVTGNRIYDSQRGITVGAGTPASLGEIQALNLMRARIKDNTLMGVYERGISTGAVGIGNFVYADIRDNELSGIGVMTAGEEAGAAGIGGALGIQSKTYGILNFLSTDIRGNTVDYYGMGILVEGVGLANVMDTQVKSNRVTGPDMYLNGTAETLQPNMVNGTVGIALSARRGPFGNSFMPEAPSVIMTNTDVTKNDVSFVRTGVMGHFDRAWVPDPPAPDSFFDVAADHVGFALDGEVNISGNSFEYIGTAEPNLTGVHVVSYGSRLGDVVINDNDMMTVDRGISVEALVGHYENGESLFLPSSMNSLTVSGNRMEDVFQDTNTGIHVMSEGGKLGPVAITGNSIDDTYAGIAFHASTYEYVNAETTIIPTEIASLNVDGNRVQNVWGDAGDAVAVTLNSGTQVAGNVSVSGNDIRNVGVLAAGAGASSKGSSDAIDIKILNEREGWNTNVGGNIAADGNFIDPISGDGITVQVSNTASGSWDITNGTQHSSTTVGGMITADGNTIMDVGDDAIEIDVFNNGSGGFEPGPSNVGGSAFVSVGGRVSADGNEIVNAGDEGINFDIYNTGVGRDSGGGRGGSAWVSVGGRVTADGNEIEHVYDDAIELKLYNTGSGGDGGAASQAGGMAYLSVNGRVSADGNEIEGSDDDDAVDIEVYNSGSGGDGGLAMGGSAYTSINGRVSADGNEIEDVGDDGIGLEVRNSGSGGDSGPAMGGHAYVSVNGRVSADGNEIEDAVNDDAIEMDVYNSGSGGDGTGAAAGGSAYVSVAYRISADGNEVENVDDGIDIRASNSGGGGDGTVGPGGTTYLSVGGRISADGNEIEMVDSGDGIELDIYNNSGAGDGGASTGGDSYVSVGGRVSADGNEVEDVEDDGIEFDIYNNGGGGDGGPAMGGHAYVSIADRVSADGNEVEDVDDEGIEFDIHNYGDAGDDNGGSAYVSVGGRVSADRNEVEGTDDDEGIYFNIYNDGDGGDRTGGSAYASIDGRISADDNKINDTDEEAIEFDLYNDGDAGDDSGGDAYLDVDGRVSADRNRIEGVENDDGIELDVYNSGDGGDRAGGDAYANIHGRISADDNRIRMIEDDGIEFDVYNSGDGGDNAGGDAWLMVEGPVTADRNKVADSVDPDDGESGDEGIDLRVSNSGDGGDGDGGSATAVIKGNVSASDNTVENVEDQGIEIKVWNNGEGGEATDPAVNGFTAEAGVNITGGVMADRNDVRDVEDGSDSDENGDGIKIAILNGCSDEDSCSTTDEGGGDNGGVGADAYVKVGGDVTADDNTVKDTDAEGIDIDVANWADAGDNNGADSFVSVGGRVSADRNDIDPIKNDGIEIDVENYGNGGDNGGGANFLSAEAFVEVKQGVTANDNKVRDTDNAAIDIDVENWGNGGDFSGGDAFVSIGMPVTADRNDVANATPGSEGAIQLEVFNVGDGGDYGGGDSFVTVDGGISSSYNDVENVMNLETEEPYDVDGVKIRVHNTGDGGDYGGGDAFLHVMSGDYGSGYVRADGNDVDDVLGDGVNIVAFNGCSDEFWECESGDGGSYGGGDAYLWIEGDLTADNNEVKDAGDEGIDIEFFNTGHAGSFDGGDAYAWVSGRVSADGNETRDTGEEGLEFDIYNDGDGGDFGGGDAYTYIGDRVSADMNDVRDAGDEGFELELYNTGDAGSNGGGDAYVYVGDRVSADWNIIKNVGEEGIDFDIFNDGDAGDSGGGDTYVEINDRVSADDNDIDPIGKGGIVFDIANGCNTADDSCNGNAGDFGGGDAFLEIGGDVSADRNTIDGTGRAGIDFNIYNHADGGSNGGGDAWIDLKEDVTADGNNIRNTGGRGIEFDIYNRGAGGDFSGGDAYVYVFDNVSADDNTVRNTGAGGIRFDLYSHAGGGSNGGGDAFLRVGDRVSADGNTVRNIGGPGIEFEIYQEDSPGDDGGGDVFVEIGDRVSADGNTVRDTAGGGIYFDIFNSGNGGDNSGGDAFVDIGDRVSADVNTVRNAGGKGIELSLVNYGDGGDDGGGDTYVEVGDDLSADGNTVRNVMTHGILIVAENNGADGNDSTAELEIAGDVTTDGNDVQGVTGSTGIEVVLTDTLAEGVSASDSYVADIDDGIVVIITDSVLGGNTVDLNDNIINQVVGEAALKLEVSDSQVGDVNVKRNEVDWDDEPNVTDPDATYGVHMLFQGTPSNPDRKNVTGAVSLEDNKVDGGMTAYHLETRGTVSLDDAPTVTGNEAKAVDYGIVFKTDGQSTIGASNVPADTAVIGGTAPGDGNIIQAHMVSVDLVANDPGDDSDRGMMSVRILGNELKAGMYEIRGTLNGNYNSDGQEPGLRAEVSGNTSSDDSFDILFDNNRTVGDTRLKVQPFGESSMEAANPGSEVTFEGDVGGASF